MKSNAWNVLVPWVGFLVFLLIVVVVFDVDVSMTIARMESVIAWLQ